MKHQEPDKKTTPSIPSMEDQLDQVTLSKYRFLIDNGMQLVGVVLINQQGERAIIDMGKVTWIDASHEKAIHDTTRKIDEF